MNRRRCTTTLRWTLPLAILLAAIWIIAPTARADSPRLVSVTLHQGLNIVGWTGEETAIDDFVGGLPATPQAVFARDPASGRWRFWSASVPGSLNTLRTIPTGAVVGLRLSAAPLGPWVYEQADSLPPTAIGPDLTPGIYQLVWHERGETRVADALRGLGDALERVWRWDGIAQRSVIAPLGANIRYGDVLTLEIGGSVYWARPTDDPTNIVWLGAVSAERKAQVRSAIDEARDWFADRYGVETAEFTLYYGDEIDAIIDGYRRLEAEHFYDELESWWRETWSGNGDIAHREFDHIVWGGQVWGSPEGVRLAAARDYFTILTSRLAGLLDSADRDWNVRQAIPLWFLEGSESYQRHRFLAGGNPQNLQNRRSQSVDVAADLSGALSSFLDWDDAVAVEWRHRDLGGLATEWLIANAGSDAPISFWRELPNHSGWRDAFRAAFEISVSDFYRRFESWRADGFPAVTAKKEPPRLAGRVLGPDARPLANFQLDACPEDARSGNCVSTTTDADGRYAFHLRPNRYMLSATMDARDCTVTRWFDGAWRDLSGHWSSTRLLDVQQRVLTSIDIELSALPGSTESAAWCDRGRPPYIGIEFVSFTGNLSGPDGPIGGVHLLACLDRDYPGRAGGVCYQGVSAANGDFYINVRKDAQYQISVEPSWNRCIWQGWYADAGPTRDRDRARTFTVGAAPVGGVDLTLSALPSELPSWSDRCNWQPD